MERYAEIDGVRVDLHEVASLAHHCDPSLCGPPDSCCADHDVWIGDRERERIVRALPAAARFARHLVGTEASEVFSPLGEDAWAIAHREDGFCVFAYRRGRQVRCSLHSAALQAGREALKAKPECCALWPLALASSRPPVLMVQAGAYAYPCNERRDPEAPLDPGVRALMKARFGRRFVHALNHRIPGA